MKRILAILLLLCLLSGCTTQGEYIPTGNGMGGEGNVNPYVPGETDQTIRLPYNRDGSFQPFTSTDVMNRGLLSLMYQGLFAYDGDYQVTPILCKAYRRSEDMRTYTFYLENATFSDGQTLTAQDVVESYRTAKKSGYYEGRFLHMKSVKANDEGAVVIQLDTPMENLPLLLDIPVVKANQVDAAVPAGTGPYLLEDTPTGKQLRRQAAWWCDTAISVNAHIIELYHGTTQKELWDLYKFSGLSMVCTEDYVDFRGDYELWESENGLFMYLGCNSKSKVFSNDAIRLALTHAIDRDELVKKYFRGFAYSATLPASPAFPHYSITLSEQYGYQPEVFAQAVANAQLEDNNVKLLVNAKDSMSMRISLAIEEILEKSGLAVTLSQLSGEDYLNALKWEEYDIYLGQTKLSPNMDLTAFFDDDGDLNFGRMADVAIHNMNQRALENSGNYQSLHQMVMEDGQLCPLLFRSYAIYGRKGLFPGLSPARDNIFHYSLGKTMEEAFIAEEP